MSMSIARGCLCALALITGPAVLAAQRPAPLTAGVVRVCADPDNMPFSNQAGEGFENKLAELVAREWNAKLEYAWWPVRRGFFNRGLRGRYCDMAMTAPSKLDMVAATTPMFRSAYVIVYRKDSGLNVTSLNDTTLKHLRIGVNLLNADAENTPPAMALSAHGVVGTLVGFPTFYSDSVRPNDIIDAVVNKTVDLAIVWGPLAGYFARQAKAPLVLNPIQFDSLTNTPFAFDISMGVRKADVALRDSLQKLLDTHRDEVQGILKQFGVPLLPIPPADSAKSHSGVRPAAPSAPSAGR